MNITESVRRKTDQMLQSLLGTLGSDDQVRQVVILDVVGEPAEGDGVNCRGTGIILRNRALCESAVNNLRNITALQIVNVFTGVGRIVVKGTAGQIVEAVGMDCVKHAIVDIPGVIIPSLPRSR